MRLVTFTLLFLASPLMGEEIHWSFRPVVQPSLPEVVNSTSARNPIDLFILRRLEKERIAPAPEATKRTLIRRVTLDLIGLPPTAADVEAFVSDPDPNAYEKLIDRLLASPHYGERWARPWLDVCHYADSDGYLTDQLRPHAWRYRHWLVEALNRDLPFDEFTVEQIAGDLLRNATVDQRIATGFLRQTLSNREGGADPKEFRTAQVVDRTATVGTTWLGLTVGCARCHDHKFDPISTQEFYELYAFFDNAAEINIDAPLPQELKPYLKARPVFEAQRRELLAPVTNEITALQSLWEKKILHARKHPGKDHVWDRQWEILGLVWGGGQGEGQLEGWEIALTPPSERSTEQKDRLLDYFLRFGSKVNSDRFKELKLHDISKEIEKLRKKLPQMSRAQTMHYTLVPRRSYIHVRGDFRSRGAYVEPTTPQVLPPLDNEEPNRLAFARWLISPANPLSRRVTVNRMWQEFFGTGLVRTPEDFGTRGDRPSHPELLDWLAVALVDHGWSTKRLHRLIVLSATYRQSSRERPNVAEHDPDNRWLARQSSLRLSAEILRDTLLSVSGLLHRKIGGRSVYPPQPESVANEGYENKWPTSEGPDRYRRGLYTFIQRTSPFAQNVTFDGADPNSSCTHRERSNTSLQALTLLNDPVFFQAAQGLARRILSESSDDAGDESRLARGFRICFSRPPSTAEKERLLAYYEQQKKILRANPKAAEKIHPAEIDGLASLPAVVDPIDAAVWTGISSVFLNLHEFITRD